MSELKSDTAAKDSEARATGRLPAAILIVVLTVLLSGALLAALFDLESRSRGWDAHTERAVIERVHALGGSYYTTGTDQKGPLWLGFYSLADRLSSPEGFWFAVAVLIIVVALATGAASAFSGYLASRNWPGALAGGVGVTMYLVLGSEEYSSVLYSRNITAVLTTVAFFLLLLQLLRAERWGSNLPVAAVSGALMGLASRPCLRRRSSLWSSLGGSPPKTAS